MNANLRHAILIILWVLALPYAQGQPMYKSVGPDGRVTYSDQPPTEGKVLKTLTPVLAPSSALPASAAEQLRRLQALRPATPMTGTVVLYSAQWCGYCKKARAYLAEKGIAYREVDIDTPDGLASYAQAGGSTGVPLLIAGGQRVQGFSASAYDRVFDGQR